MPGTRREFLRATATGVAGWTLLGTRIGWADPASEGPPPQSESPFLRGNFGPVSEEVTADRLPVLGEIPRELAGMFVRNGPNPQFPPLGNYHWFDGDGMLHGVRIVDGVASYRNRWVRTAGWQEERAAGRALWGGLSDPPNLNKVLSGKPPFKNAANTALVWHDGRLLCLWEGGEPYHVRLPELETVGPYDFAGRLKHPFTAHPKLDPVTGEMLCFGYSALTPFVQYSVVNAAGELVSTEGVRLPRPVMMHDFAVTERHTLFLDLPATFNLARVGRGEPILKFEPDFGARIGVLPRHGAGSEIRWFDVATCFVFHTLNAWDDGDDVVLLACRMDTYPDLLGTGPPPSDLAGEPRPPLTRLHRWRLNLATGAVGEEPLDEVFCEFPRVNDARLGRATRFGFAMDIEQGGLVKFDLERGTHERTPYGPGRQGGEGVFVPRPGAMREDDGWLLNYVYDAAEGKSELVILEAGDFTGRPVARVKLPARVPYGFHGTWVDEGQLAAGRTV